jgi:four helix bundle protein
MEYIYEKLEAWQDAVNFANQVMTLLSKTSRNWANRDLLERAEECSADIAVAITRAKCSNSRDEIIQQLYQSRRSLYEAMTLLEIFRKNRWISDSQFEFIKSCSQEVGLSLVHMMKGTSPDPARQTALRMTD